MREPASVFLDPAIAASLRITTISKDTNVYIEIYRRLRSLIERGILKPGDPLPGEAALSAMMCVGRTSLRTALSILYEDGYIETVRGKGSCVSGDSRNEQYRRRFPTDILLAPERIALLGELSVLDTQCDLVRGDEFLIGKVAAAPGGAVVQFQQVYCLNEKPAVLSFFYVAVDRFPAAVTDDPAQIYAALHELLHMRTLTAEYECVPIRSTNPSGLHQLLPRGVQTLVTTQYIGADGPFAFGKDYYNCDVMRFRFAMRK